jgi:hypothetical protein
MKIIAPGSKKFQLPKQGTHLATLSEYEDLGFQPDVFNEGQEKHQIKLVFELEAGGRQFFWCNFSLHPMSKLYEVVSALLGANPPEIVELDELIGNRCEVEIEHYTNAKRQLRSKIVDFRRAK